MSVVSKINNVFEVNLTKQDDDWNPKSISSEDLAVAMGLNPLEWTVWRKYT
jgi:hypothetical protein